MLRFKQFLLVKEELNDSQRAEYNAMPRSKSSLAATDHYFGKGNDVISKPLENTIDKSEVHKATERHLGQQIAPEDYKVGLATDKYGRKAKIGGLLAKTKAPSDLINGFANDSTRQAKNAKGLTTVTTRSPGGDPSKGDKSGVAGQTSPNQSWEQQSCKNVDSGMNRKYLPDEIKHGTVVTYLHDHNGKEIARATLQPHLNSSRETAYDVDSHYGINHAGFRAHAEQLAKDLSKPIEKLSGSVVFNKHKKVYNDSGVESILHPNATSEHVTKALDDPQWRIRAAALRHPSVTPNQITKALKDSNSDIRLAAIKHPNATSEHITKALKDSSLYVRSAAAKHPNATSEHITKALDDRSMYIRRAAVENPNATTDHITKALKDPEEFVREAAISHPNATSEHITKALDDPHEEVREAASQQQNAKAKNESFYSDFITKRQLTGSIADNVKF